ncbi:MAG TPA: HAD family hydrolase [Ktedonobacteraceae bacterium]|nr:HAD family hydrolase [Ktedonobacteraceae bacterium]
MEDIHVGHIRGVILDVDGTLVDSNDAQARAWIESMAQFGHFVAYEKVRWLIGEAGDKVIPQMIGLPADTPEGKQISARRGAVFSQRFMGSLQAFPEVRELVQRMLDAGLKIAIGSSAKQDELQKLLTIADIADLVSILVSSSDVQASKPNPSIVDVALKKLELQPDEVIMIGDTPYDIEAAARANVGTIAVRCGGWTDKELARALAIYNDPADLLAHYDTSPLAQ